MIGVEGGIPYSTPHRTLVVHRMATVKGRFNRPLCGADPWHYKTTTNPEHVTCSACKEQQQP